MLRSLSLRASPLLRAALTTTRGSQSAATVTATARMLSRWAGVPMGPPDPILGVSDAFRRDTDPRKVNVGVGAYRDDKGQPVVIKSVVEATKRVLDGGLNNEYGPISGDAVFVQLSTELAFGKNAAPLKEGRVAAAQTLSGTGALRLAGEFINRFGRAPIYVPDPTWGTHFAIFNDSGLETRTYRYYNKATKGLDAAGLVADIRAAPEKSVFLLHACAHNPTGVDPSTAQWAEISAALKARGHLVLLDMAYQGFASGDPERDAQALQQLLKDGHNIILAQSFAKNFGLYGQRVGCLSIVCDSAEERTRVDSQVKILARPIYSNPPIHGARIVRTILEDPKLAAQWRVDVKEMADRIIAMRTALRANLEKLGSKLPWNHITDQIGMFCFTGLTPEQVDRLTAEFRIYLTRNGRISMAGVTTGNVEYIAKAIHEVTK